MHILKYWLTNLFLFDLIGGVGGNAGCVDIYTTNNASNFEVRAYNGAYGDNGMIYAPCKSLKGVVTYTKSCGHDRVTLQ